MANFGAGGHFKHLASQVGGRPIAGGTVVQSVGLRTPQVDQVLHAVDGHAGVHHQHVGNLGHQRDRCEIFSGVVIELGVHVRRHHHAGRLTDQNCVAIASRLGDQIGCNGARGTRAVFDDH